MTKTPVVLLTGLPGVTLRQFVSYDAEPLFRLIDSNREHLSQRGDSTAGKYPDLKSVLDSITNPPNPAKLRFGVWHMNRLVGTVNLTPASVSEEAEIGYWIGQEYCGNGFAKTAAVTLTAHALSDLGYKKIIATVAMGNLASQKVLKRTGFLLERTMGCAILASSVHHYSNEIP